MVHQRGSADTVGGIRGFAKMFDMSLTKGILCLLDNQQTICMNQDILEIEDKVNQQLLEENTAILNRIAGRTHHIHAREFIQDIVLDFEDLVKFSQVYQYNIRDLQFVAKLTYVGLLTDLNWKPKPFTLILIGQALGYLSRLPQCQYCQLPHRQYCFNLIPRDINAEPTH